MPKISKLIKKEYYENDQQLILDTFEVRTGTDCSLDVHCSGHFLFTVVNQSYFTDYDKINKVYKMMNDSEADCSCVPFYFDQRFFIPKFTGITEDDIIKCGYYFTKEVLKLFLIFNISVKKQENSCCCKCNASMEL